MPLTITDAARRARPIGATYSAWCEGYATAIARRSLRAGGRAGTLAAWWRSGYQHGRRQRRRMEQVELFDGGSGESRDDLTRGAACAGPRKPGRAAKGARAAAVGGPR